MSLKSNFSESDLILFNLWVDSEHALNAFTKWKTEKMSHIKKKNIKKKNIKKKKKNDNLQKSQSESDGKNNYRRPQKFKKISEMSRDELYNLRSPN